ncbi:uncharacterized protein LOC115817201 [Chanos chanos]|uniref:Uncharacterized protein LOC115817201 n=1 Tax=Chanos chanos TaxID=29144 RepID=A0A6J2VWX3_CHACN|nr:uncharacterized protein LOC115817201 [Chanos chanos]
MPQLLNKEVFLDIDLFGIAKNNNGSASAALISYSDIDEMLDPSLLHPKNNTVNIMMSPVVSAFLPKTPNKILTKPVNFTMRHIKKMDPKGLLHCVYWNVSEWVVDGCSITETNSSYTVCSCVHLSTFALIMQTQRPPKRYYLLKLLSTVAVGVGLVSLFLTVLTFIGFWKKLGRKTTARLNLCISLLLAHLLFLLTQHFLHYIKPHEVNVILFTAMIITLKKTLIQLSDISQVKATRAMVFKSLAQFIILGCPWLLGLLTHISENVELVFLLFTSQQGTFIFLVHCVLNAEVRKQYAKVWQSMCCGSKSKTPDVCNSYKNISDPSRNILFRSTSFPGWPPSDSTLEEGWYRFTGVGGDVVATECPSSPCGATTSPLTICETTIVAIGNRLIRSWLCSGTREQGWCLMAQDFLTTLVCPQGFHLYYLFPTQGRFVTKVNVFTVGPGRNISKMPQLLNKEVFLDIDLFGIAKNNNGNASAALISYSDIDEMLDPSLLHPKNNTVNIMMSPVLSAFLPKTPNKILTKPVNFTMRHIKEMDPKGLLHCVYWNGSEWVVDGCSITETNSSYTVCSCVHLSTFALIMQTQRPPKSNYLLKLLSTVAVGVGLVSVFLTVLTFIGFWKKLGRKTTARLNLCISLLLAHLLFLLTQHFLHYIKPHEVVCKALAGTLHFLFLSAFMWMSAEAILLLNTVKNLSKLTYREKEELHWAYQLTIGYAIPLTVIALSEGLVPEMYDTNICWIKTENDFIWIFVGPVCCILGVNVILITTTMITLGKTIIHLSDISQVKATKTMVFKSLAQFIILGCPWLLGLLTHISENVELVFLLFMSQQGTFIFLVHCILNAEVRKQYAKVWQSMCCGGKSKTPV